MADTSSDTAATATDTKVQAGSCLCGKVRYELSGEPFTFVLCHCNNCRKASGSSFMANVFFTQSQVKVLQGESDIKVYDDTENDSGGTVHRSFCSNCGCPIFATNKTYEGVVIVTSGTLDGEYEWKPQNELYCKRRRGWVPEVEGTNRLQETFPAASA
ncbi:hypothetical protein BOTBODRAFT_153498 [Botryobasidium botryosum FD-172 SS1]|uniref:CENP-V/GFA domain-containing protein n=1 Tax=Botryobasidium botryosum (strain FD-172 SS1) TaxID=930990 RepID=A0A067N700_BOTB1|nr:hypothetical protein BOTBODRAFT_153498 [Botryobasidium botryosum FD-172 SS1]